ncbi:MAG: glycosyltransferase [Saprospiraceae bacterium]|nr:glycosyltransferase [Saprospiraceae bacterium]MCF8250835.1 glycosyltransferase [Saprospiraceae bacterium]MCF8281652.1 glycosyltransferase [Bacteroidales bacterium]MCF8312636.1 glycosyltransferase [Saprospiraceae bacterium]MCF8441026.1 glycosyltransferase [Saprospiraceae bacterium]
MSNRKCICLTITSLAIGGAEKQCLLLAKALQPHHDVFVVIVQPQPRHPGHLAMIAEAKIEHYFLAGNPVQRIWDFAGLLKKKHTSLIFSFLPADSFYAAIAGSIAKIPFRIGGIRNDRMHPLKAQMLKFLHNRIFDFSISNSFSGARFFIKKGFASEKMLVVHNGISINTQPIARPPKMEIIIASAGRFVPQKDYETALKSITRLREICPLETKIHYWIIGFGPDENLIRSQVEEYGLQAEVTLIVNPDNLPELYRQADIYLCTSTFEGLSNAIMEAMAYSLPVVATRVGDNDQLVQHGANGFLTEVKEIEAISQHLQVLVLSHADRIRTGQAGYEHLKQNFSFEAFQKKYLQIVERVTNPG